MILQVEEIMKQFYGLIAVDRVALPADYGSDMVRFHSR